MAMGQLDEIARKLADSAASRLPVSGPKKIRNGLSCLLGNDSLVNQVFDRVDDDEPATGGAGSATCDEAVAGTEDIILNIQRSLVEDRRRARVGWDLTNVHTRKRRKTTDGRNPVDRDGDNDEDDVLLADSDDEAVGVDVNEDDKMDDKPPVQGGLVIGDDLADDEPVPVVHPHFVEIESRLGPRKPDDGWCYMCDVVNHMNPEKRPPEVTNLVVQLMTYNMASRDKVNVAIYTKALYEQDILRPVHRKPSERDKEVVKEWTLRSIYTHITEKANGSSYILEEELSLVGRILHSLEMGLWRAPRSKVNSRTNSTEERYLSLDHKNLNCIDKMLTKSVSLVNAREKLRNQDMTDMYGGNAIGGSAANLARGRRSGGGRRDITVSTLAGAAAGRAAQRTSDRMLQMNAGHLLGGN